MSLAWEPPALPPDPLAWRALANCRGMVLDVFYPEGEDTPSAEALEACGACIVRTDCLLWGVEHEDSGIWGGLTARQRARMRRSAGIRLDAPQAHVPHGIHLDPQDPPDDPDEDEEDDSWR
jgi:hypothetical protein